jgi:hypothetical protein
MLELHGMNLISSLPQEPLPIYLDRRNNRPAGRSAGDRGISSGDDAMALSDYFLHHRDVIPVSPSGRAEQRSRPGLLRRLLDALVESRLQQTEHEIARISRARAANSPTRLSAKLKSVFIPTAGSKPSLTGKKLAACTTKRLGL